MMESHRVTVDPVSLNLDCLRQIWVEDVDDRKEKAVKYLSFIHICSQIDREAPFANADPTEVIKLAKKDIFGDYEFDFNSDWVFDEDFMSKSVADYQLAFEKAEDAVIRTFNKKIYQLNEVIDKTEPEITKSVTRGTVTYVSNTTILNKVMIDMIKVIKTRDEIYATVIKDSTKGDRKGGRKLSQLEKRRSAIIGKREPIDSDKDAL